MAKPEVDLELKKAFQEQQEKLIFTRQTINQADAQLEACRRGERHAELVLKEVETNEAANPKIRLFESVGRT